jgi:hypothetical protein
MHSVILKTRIYSQKYNIRLFSWDYLRPQRIELSKITPIPDTPVFFVQLGPVFAI